MVESLGVGVGVRDLQDPSRPGPSPTLFPVMSIGFVFVGVKRPGHPSVGHPYPLCLHGMLQGEIYFFWGGCG